MASKGTAPYEDRPLWPTESTWSVATNKFGTVANAVLNYGDIHELMHRDISLGNDFRKERIKLMITLASGVFALTVTFHKDLFHEAPGPFGLGLMTIGWATLLASLLMGILHLKHWEDFYLEHRALGKAIWRLHTATTPDEQDAARIEFLQAKQKVDDFQEGYRWANTWQTGTLLVGLAFTACYVLVSFSRPTSPSVAENKSCCCAACVQPTPPVSPASGATNAPPGK